MERLRAESISSSSTDLFFDQTSQTLNTPNTPNTQISSGGAKKVNVEVIMRSNPFRVGKFSKIWPLLSTLAVFFSIYFIWIVSVDNSKAM